WLLACPIGCQRITECVDVCRHNSQSVSLVRSPAVSRKADIADRVTVIGQVTLETFDNLSQRRFVPAGKRQNMQRTFIFLRRTAGFGRLLNNDMGVGAAETKGTDPTDAFTIFR